MQKERLTWLKVVFLATVVFGGAGCGSDDLLGPDARQGIEGIALLGPMCPVQSQANPCPDEPYEANIGIRDSGGGFVTRVRTGDDGRFRVGLRPGTYLLQPEAGDPFPTAGDQTVDVVAGAYTDVTVLFDTGIR